MKEQYWSEMAKQARPYIPGEQPKISDLIKLNTNENPYPPSPKAIQALSEVDTNALRLYPDPESTSLCQCIAVSEGVSEDQVFIGNGSDEVLALTFMAFFNNGEDQTVAMPDISYSFYPVYARLFNIPTKQIPIRDDFSLHVDDYCGQTGGVIFANPNAPTGLAIDLDDIRRICGTNNRLVVVDEAYVAFGADSAKELLQEYDNLLVIRTLSKSHSLAGLRVGYALGHPDLIEGLERIKNSFNSYPIDRLAQVVAESSIKDQTYTLACSEKIMDTREKTRIALEDMGFLVLDSKTNFLFCTHEQYSAETIQNKLREKAILVRRFSIPKIANYLRISIGTEEEMQQLVRVLHSIVLD